MPAKTLPPPPSGDDNQPIDLRKALEERYLS